MSQAGVYATDTSNLLGYYVYIGVVLRLSVFLYQHGRKGQVILLLMLGVSYLLWVVKGVL